MSLSMREILPYAVGAAAAFAVDIATLASQIHTEEEDLAPSVVKAVGSPIGTNRLRALYFTRATAPYGDGPRFCWRGRSRGKDVCPWRI